MTAQLVADDILKLAKRRDKLFTPLQLMKLVYIAYGWHLAFTGKKLFRDRIEAWKYGPVIPNLYRVTKRFGRDEIPAPLIGDGPLHHGDLERFLSSVVDNYGDFSGIALSNLTHREGTPWKQVYRPNEFSAEIPDDVIEEHYKAALSGHEDRSRND